MLMLPSLSFPPASFYPAWEGIPRRGPDGIIRDLVAWGDTFCSQIAVELVGTPTYILLDQDVGEDLDGCGAFTGPDLCWTIRPHIHKWFGPGFACVVKKDALAHTIAEAAAIGLIESGQVRMAREVLASILVHELAHALRDEHALDWHRTPDPAGETVAQTEPTTRPLADRVRAANRNLPSGLAPRNLPAHAGHDAEFVRTLCHLVHRAQALGVTTLSYWTLPGVYGLSPIAKYLEALGDEPERMKGKAVATILASPAPEAFTALWQADTASGSDPPPAKVTVSVPLPFQAFSPCDLCGTWSIDPTRARMILDLAASPPGRIPDALAVVPRERGQSGRIEVIQARGVLMKSPPWWAGGTSTIDLRRQIRAAANNSDVSGILLVVDSPGGTVAGTDDLARDVRSAGTKKPVWVQIEDLAGASAYWVASQAEKVFVNSSTALVGSIGSMLVVYDTSAANEKDGVKALVFATGKLKGAGTDGIQITEDEQRYFQGLVDVAQVAFDEAVQKGRGFTKEQLAKVRTGELFAGDEALKVGLVDGVQSMDETGLQLQAAIEAKGKR